MKKLSKQQRIVIAKSRFDNIDWQLPLSIEEIDFLHAQLPKRLDDEDIVTWAQRIRQSHSLRFSGIREIIRRAAADDQYLTESVIYTEDESLRLTIQRIASMISVKVEALGFSSDRYANRVIGISSRGRLEQFIAVIPLDADGDGQMDFEASDDVCEVFLNPKVSPLIGFIE